MQLLKKEELLEIEGGISITGTIINAIVRGINAFLELGRSVGTAIRRVGGNQLCPIS